MIKCLSDWTGLIFSMDNMQIANPRVFPLACSNVEFVFKCLQTPFLVTAVESFYVKSTWLASTSALFVRITRLERKWNAGFDFYWKKCRIPANTAKTRFRKRTSTCTKHIALNARVVAASRIASSSLASRLKRYVIWLSHTGRRFGRAILTLLPEVSRICML